MITADAEQEVEKRGRFAVARENTEKGNFYAAAALFPPYRAAPPRTREIYVLSKTNVKVLDQKRKRHHHGICLNLRVLFDFSFFHLGDAVTGSLVASEWGLVIFKSDEYRTK